MSLMLGSREAQEERRENEDDSVLPHGLAFSWWEEENMGKLVYFQLKEPRLPLSPLFLL